jgi:hypothetical protein
MPLTPLGSEKLEIPFHERLGEISSKNELVGAG